MGNGAIGAKERSLKGKDVQNLGGKGNPIVYSGKKRKIKGHQGRHLKGRKIFQKVQEKAGWEKTIPGRGEG